MGVEIARKKKRDFLVSAIYLLQKLLPLRNTEKLKLFLKLEWIFDRLAHEKSFGHYKTENHPIRVNSVDFILKNINETSIVLDLGCKHGDISMAIANRAAKVIGVDFDAAALEIAKKKHQKENLVFIQTDAASFLKSSNENFDVLILSHILEHLDNRIDFLNEYKKFFKLIYIEVPDFDKTYLNHYRKDLEMELIYTDNDHVVEFDRNELKKLLSTCNLEIISEEYKFGVMKIWCKRQ